MFFAVLTWAVGVVLLTLMLWWHVRRAHVAAAAMLMILVPQVYARPALFFLDLHHPYPADLFLGPAWQLVSIGLLVSIVWMALIFITHLVLNRAMAPVGRLMPKVHGEINPRYLLAATVFTTVLGAVLTGVLVIRAGSIGNMMYLVKVEKALAGSYIIREISVVGAFFSVIAMLYFERRVRSAPPHANGRGMVWFCVVLFLVNLTSNYVWGNRYNIAMLLLGLGLSWHLTIRRFSVLKVIILVLITAGALQSLKSLRTETVGDALGKDVSGRQPFWEDVSTSLHLSQFDALMLAMRDAGKKFEFREGKDFKNGFLSWIPRRFYPEKETFHVGVWFRRIYQPEKINGWPITTMGDWYVNFNYWGIILGALLSGWVAAIFDAGYKNVQTSLWQGAAAPSLALLIFDGGVDPGFPQAVALIYVPLCMLAVILNLTSIKRTRAVAAVARYRQFLSESSQRPQ